MSGAWPYAIVLVGALATYAWRGVAVAAGGRLKIDSAAVQWFGAVTFALVAALIARMILLPIGSLTATGLGLRLGAAALGVAVYFLFRRNLLLGVGAGAGLVMALA
jgi:branched-subunit amino acid transport protein